METQISRCLSGSPHKPPSIAEFLDLMPVPVAILTKIDGKIVVTNRALDDLLGVASGSLWGGDASCLFPKIGERRSLRDKLLLDRSVRGFKVSHRACNGRDISLSVWMEWAVCDQNECVIAILIDAAEEAIVEKRLYRKLGELRQRLQAAADSRELFASDIHDGVVQQTVGALMLLRAARSALEQDPARALRQLDAVEKALQQGLKEARQLMESARPTELEELGLVASLQALLDRAAQTSALSIQFRHSLQTPKIAPEIERDIYRVVQECLNNAWFHSKATEVSVDLTEAAGFIEVVVVDNGQGFDPQQVKSGRRGLRGMRLRAEMHGGKYDVDAAEGRGCTIRATFPLRQTDAEESLATPGNTR